MSISKNVFILSEKKRILFQITFFFHKYKTNRQLATKTCFFHTHTHIIDESKI